MAGFEFFDRDIKVATAGLDHASIRRELARFAKQELTAVISSGQASSTYERYVNGRRGAAEESVSAPGPIVYEFINWPRIITLAIAELIKRSPKRSGRYASSFVVLSNGAPVTQYETIPGDAEVIVFNAQPYTRKLDNAGTGGRRHFLGAYYVLRRSFAEMLDVKNTYLSIGAGVHPLVPYVLKRGGRRKGRQAGAKLTYPALVINVL